VKNITLVQKSSAQVNGGRTVSLVRKALMLEAVGCTKLFSCENLVNF
jgi:hypothetical protein